MKIKIILTFFIITSIVVLFQNCGSQDPGKGLNFGGQSLLNSTGNPSTGVTPVQTNGNSIYGMKVSCNASNACTYNIIWNVPQGGGSATGTVVTVGSQVFACPNSRSYNQFTTTDGTANSQGWMTVGGTATFNVYASNNCALPVAGTVPDASVTIVGGQ